MHFNSDMTGDIKLTAPDGVDHDEFPGELIRSYVRRYVLGGLADEFSNLLHRANEEWGGKDHPSDYARVLYRIDDLLPAKNRDGTLNKNTLFGRCYFFGTPMHFAALRVTRNDSGCLETVDPTRSDELDQTRVCRRRRTDLRLPDQ